MKLALRAVLAAGGVVAALTVLIAVAGFSPGSALTALWSGSFGSSYAVFSATLVRATPLILTGLAVALAFRGGVLNIGAEGQLLAGAAASTALVLAARGAPAAILLPGALAVGAAVGAAWAFLPAWLRVRFRVLEVISTIMMTFLALYLVSYLVRGPLQEPLRIYPQSPPIPEAARLPMLIAGARMHAGLLLAVLAAVVSWVVLTRTASGFRLRATGASPTVARNAGLVDVDRVTMRVFLASGALAGLAGAIEVTGVTYALYENISPGYGYTAIAVALLAGLNPIGVAVSGIFLGGLQAGAAAMQRDAGVPSVLVSVVEALVILVIVGAQSVRGTGLAVWRSRA